MIDRSIKIFNFLIKRQTMTINIKNQKIGEESEAEEISAWE